MLSIQHRLPWASFQSTANSLRPTLAFRKSPLRWDSAATEMRYLTQSAILISALATGSMHAAAQQREWPFYIPADVSPPAVQDQDWPQNHIDRFVLRRLEQQGLAPAPSATQQQLVRRLYLNLLGVPPTPDEAASFLQDTSADAWQKLVDRLLDDPRYGERWARFWLDLARYADTAGYEGDPDLPHAWRYRDYVIDSLNRDKPYDLFIREQLAGDEFNDIMGAGDLPSTPPERTVALTFLRLAPFTEPRGDESRHELLSEITTTVSSVFLGLTVGCAKCHDHKYDNIPTEDFYRLQAFFSTIQIPRPLEGDPFQIGGPIAAAFYRDGEAEWANNRRTQLRQQAESAKAELEILRRTLLERMDLQAGFGIQAMGGNLGNNYIYSKHSINDNQSHLCIANCNGEQWQFHIDGLPVTDTGSNAGTNTGQWFADLPAPKHMTLGQYSQGTGAIQTANAHHLGEFSQIMIYDHPLNEAELTALNSWSRNTGSGSPPTTGLQFWLDANDIDANPNTPNPPPGTKVPQWSDRIIGITLRQDNADKQPSVFTLPDSSENAVSFDNAFMTAALDQNSPFLSDQSGSIVVICSARHSHEGYGFAVGGDGSFISTFINPGAEQHTGIDSLLADASDDRITREERHRYQELSGREKFLPQHLKRLEPAAMSLRHSYGPPYEPGVPVTRVMIRGEHDNPGKVVEAGFPSVVTGHQNPASIRLDPFKRWPTRSRRMALANWIASENNPLTARVMVNRLWYRHFGRGIVASPSDFGALSDGPSHPLLLDWLASEFVRNGWSLKAIHRLILNSATWQQTSIHQNTAAAESDPDNTLLWRFRRRRLEAEAVRDSVLSVSGRLNPEQFGLPIFPPLPEDISERVKYSNSKWDTQYGPEGRKRSIYIYQQRTLNMPFLQTFDASVCDESRPRRHDSITPLQALAMYNGDFVHNEACCLAERVAAEAGASPQKRIRHAFQIAFTREPAQAETDQLLKLISESDDPEEGLAAVCRVLLNSSEFVYID